MGQFRTRKRGRTWEYSFEGARIDGKRNTISKSGFSTKADAISAGTAAKAEYDNAGRVFSPSTISVHDYFAYWLKNYAEVECKPNTVRIYSDIIRIHLNPYLGKYALASLSPDILQEHINRLYTNNLSGTYLKHIICVLSASLDYAFHPAGFLKENPLIYWKVERPSQRYFRCPNPIHISLSH